MQSIVRQLEADLARLRALAPGNRPHPRIVIPGSGAPPPVLRSIHGASHRPLLLPDGRQPATWDEVYWLAGQNDGTYFASLGGRDEIIRVTDGVVKTFDVEHIAKWRTAGRVDRETEGENRAENPDPETPHRRRRPGINPEG